MTVLVAYARRALAGVPPRSEVLIAAGIALLAVGAAMIYPPAGVIAGGVALAAWGVGEAKADARTQSSQRGARP